MTRHCTKETRRHPRTRFPPSREYSTCNTAQPGAYWTLAGLTGSCVFCNPESVAHINSGITNHALARVPESSYVMGLVGGLSKLLVVAHTECWSSLRNNGRHCCEQGWRSLTGHSCYSTAGRVSLFVPPFIVRHTPFKCRAAGPLALHPSPLSLLGDSGARPQSQPRHVHPSIHSRRAARRVGEQTD
jgi:hypothetical protein